MMFHFHGQDAGSDDGYWSVIVSAPSEPQANKILLNHLRRLGRADLYKDFGVEPIKGEPIIHSTVQQ